MPDCPKWLLSEAKKEWDRLCVKLSEMGVLTEIDMAASGVGRDDEDEMEACNRIMWCRGQ